MLFEQEMVNGIASQLFEDNDSNGYAVLELSGELERFRLTRFNNRFIEQLKGSEPKDKIISETYVNNE